MCAETWSDVTKEWERSTVIPKIQKEQVIELSVKKCYWPTSGGFQTCRRVGIIEQHTIAIQMCTKSMVNLKGSK